MTEIWRCRDRTGPPRPRPEGVGVRSGEGGVGRLDAVNPRLNAIVAHRPECARRRRLAIDRRIARGQDPGPLAGVPVTVKINVDQGGFATTNGTRLQRDLVAEANSPVVDNLVRAGAVLLGRSNAPAFALRWFTSNLLHGATQNPRDPALTPGGSTGGGAAAVPPGSGMWRTAPISAARSAIRPMPAACMASGRRSGALRPTTPPGPSAGSAGSSWPCPGRRPHDRRPPRGARGNGGARSARSVVGPGAARRAERAAQRRALSAPRRVGDRAGGRGRSAGRRAAPCRCRLAVEKIADTPPIHEAAELQARLWLGDGFAALAEAAAREGDPGALAVVAAFRRKAESCPRTPWRALVRRASLIREWLLFFAKHPVLVLPVSAELPFRDGLDLEGAAAFRALGSAADAGGVPTIGVPALPYRPGSSVPRRSGCRSSSGATAKICASGPARRSKRAARRPRRSTRSDDPAWLLHFEGWRIR